MQRLSQELLTHISSFLCYEDKKSSHTILGLEDGLEKTIFRLKYVGDLFSHYFHFPVTPKDFNIVGENWYVPLVKNVDHMKPRYLIQLCLLRQYLNYVTDRKNCVYLKCPRCLEYIEIKLMLTDGDSFRLDLYIYRKGGIKKTVCFCPCMIKGRVDRDEPQLETHLIQGDEIVNYEYVQDESNALRVQYDVKDSSRGCWANNLYSIKTWLSYMVLGSYGRVNTHKNMTKEEAEQGLSAYMEYSDIDTDEDVNPRELEISATPLMIEDEGNGITFSIVTNS